LPLFKALIRYESLNSGLRNLVPRIHGHRSIMWCKAYFNILNRLGMTHSTDRQTDIIITYCTFH